MRDLTIRLTNRKTKELVSLLDFVDDHIGDIVKHNIRVYFQLIKYKPNDNPTASATFEGHELRGTAAVMRALKGLLRMGGFEREKQPAMRSFQMSALQDGDEPDDGVGSNNIKSRVDRMMERRAPKLYSGVGKSQGGDQDIEPEQRQPSKSINPDKLFGPIDGDHKSTISERVGGLSGEILNGLSGNPDGDQDTRVGDDYDLMSAMLSNQQDSDALFV